MSFSIRLYKKILSMMFAAFLLAACGVKERIVYQTLPLQICPVPLPPELPKVLGNLEDEETQVILIERERQVRSYIKRLRKSLECYERQVKQ